MSNKTRFWKGDKWERDLAARFSERFADHLGVPDGFIRNRSSGAYFGGKNTFRTSRTVQENQTVGDIITPMSFRFVIESKAYKTPPSFKSILQGHVGQWNTWLDQVVHDAASVYKAPLLAVKYNNVPWLAFTDSISGCKPDIAYRYNNITYFAQTLDSLFSYQTSWFFEVK